MAPSATPSAAQKSSTRAGLITRLNELTIDSTNATSEPMLAAAMTPLIADGSVLLSISGLRIQVAAAVRITTPSAIAVFWTTESIVIGPPVATGACVPY